MSTAAEEAVAKEISESPTDDADRMHAFGDPRCQAFYDGCNCPTVKQYLEMQAAAVRREEVIQKLIEHLYEWGDLRREHGLKIVPRIKPSHGNCCTCQDCGYHHDQEKQ